MSTLRKRCLPAEWAPQRAIQLTWPHGGTDWADHLREVDACYVRMAREIAARERLIIVTPEPERIMDLLEGALPFESLVRISLLECPTDDTWARDHAFLTVVDEGDSAENKVLCEDDKAGCEVEGEANAKTLLDFRFNGWGGKFPAEQDNAINRRLYDSEILQDLYGEPLGYEPHLDFELEGGSIESDGRGTLLTTTRCNLNPNRRSTSGLACQEGGGTSGLVCQEGGSTTLPHSAADVRAEVEARLKETLGAERILWLESGGLEQDDTDGHIDTLARLCPDDTIVYGEGDARMLSELQAFRTPEGRPYRLVAVPPYYANFLIMNGAVLLPFYEDADQNERARKALQQVFPDREVIGIDCRILLTQNGSLHCCTMQYPG